MKRYERMTKEDIISAYNSVYCDKCLAKNWCNGIKRKFTCRETLTEWLNHEIEIKKVHRYELIKSPEDVSKAYSEFDAFCYGGKRCESCKFVYFNNRTRCFVQYLNEEIEVEE